MEVIEEPGHDIEHLVNDLDREGYRCLFGMRSEGMKHAVCYTDGGKMHLISEG